MSELIKMLQLINRKSRIICLLSACYQNHVTRNYSAGEISAASGVPYKTLRDEKKVTETQLPARSDAVVIGGGAMGCSTLYHLSKMGVKNAILLEKEQLTAGTTWHSAGLLWCVRSNETQMLLSNRTKHLLDTLEEDTGVHPGFHQNGGLFTASVPDRLKEYRRLQTFSKYMNVESYILNPSETKKLYPLLNVDDILGTLYSPSDGNIDPAGYCTALARGAKQNGAEVFIDTPVEEIETYVDDFGKQRVKAVLTRRGRVETDNVIVCGGCWAPHIVKNLDIQVPQFTFRHSYVVTERMEGVVGMPSVTDRDLSIYMKCQGDVLQIGGYEPNPVPLDEGVAKDFAFGLYDLDWEAFGGHIESACKRIPELEKAGIRSTVSGPESFTPDAKPLMGPNPVIKGLFHAHGFNSGGVMLSGGSGDMLAQWVVNGEPELDMFSLDIRRYNEKLIGNTKWIRERSHEYYHKHYSIEYHFDEPLAGRGVMKDPLYDVLLKDGCFFQQKGGWERPAWFDKATIAPPLPYDYYGAYGNIPNDPYPYNDQLRKDYTFDHPKQHDSIGADCMSARNKAALFNMSYFGKLYITGPDALAAAEWIFSNHMDKQPGATTYTCIVNKLGGTESDLTVSVVDDDGPQAKLGVTEKAFYVAVGGVFSPYVKSLIKKVIAEKQFNCQVQDLSHDMVLLSLQGPKSRDILSKLVDVDLSNEAFPFSSHKLVNIAGHSARAMRLSFVGELGWEIHAANEAALDIYHDIHEVGKQFGLCNSGYRALDSLSTEKGYRMWHSDLRSDDSPLEADMGFTCKLKSDVPFMGREALEAQKVSGLKKRIMCFVLEDNVVLHGLETILRNGEIVGYLRRAEYGFFLNKELAYGYVQAAEDSTVNKEYLLSGNYEIEKMGQRYKAQAFMKSPFDPKNLRLKGIYN